MRTTLSTFGLHAAHNIQLALTLFGFIRSPIGAEVHGHTIFCHCSWPQTPFQACVFHYDVFSTHERVFFQFSSGFWVFLYKITSNDYGSKQYFKVSKPREYQAAFTLFNIIW